jgi:hypothetical protein
VRHVSGITIQGVALLNAPRVVVLMYDSSHVFIDRIWMTNALDDYSLGLRQWRPWYKHGEDGSEHDHDGEDDGNAGDGHGSDNDIGGDGSNNNGKRERERPPAHEPLDDDIMSELHEEQRRSSIDIDGVRGIQSKGPAHDLNRIKNRPKYTMGKGGCNVDGIQLNNVQVALIQRSSLHSGSETIVARFGSRWIMTSHMNIYGGHGIGAGAISLHSVTNACNLYIAYEHITMVSSRWGVRVKLPPQTSYQHGWLSYTDICLVAPGQAVSIVTAEAKAVVGTSYVRATLKDFVVPGKVIFPCACFN